LVCHTFPAGAPSSGPTLPDSRTTAVDYLLQPEQVVETSGAVTRTTTTSYGRDGRLLKAGTDASGFGGAADTAGDVAASTTGYDPTSGLVDSTSTAAGTSRMSYDRWGRARSYTNQLGESTRTDFDGAGRVATVVDPKGTTSYGYGPDSQGREEHRGLPTSMTVSGVGSFSAAYDADGKLTDQNLPGGVSQSTQYDDAGEPIGLSYSGQVSTVDGTGAVTVGTGPWLSWSQDNDPLGRVAREWTPAGSAFTDGPGASPTDTGDAISYDRRYNYDQAGRLTTVNDRTADTTGSATPDDPSVAAAAACTARSYTFDSNGNRTALTTSTGSNGACAGASSSTKASSYDSADRTSTAAGYTYDALGRTLTLAAADSPAGPAAGNISLAYYDTDAARSVSQNASTTSYTLDAEGRRLIDTTTPTAGGTATRTLKRHYTDSSDNPGWTEETPAPGGGSAPLVTRYTQSLGGDLGVTAIDGGPVTLTLANLHGDLNTTVTLPTTGNATSIDSWSDYTEYGTPRPASTTTSGAQYGWLGAQQRSADTGAGLLLMGARLYNPTSGRFTSQDPEAGGNENAYNYPNDPMNTSDLDGRCPWCLPAIAGWGGVGAIGAADWWNPVGWVIGGALLGYGGYRVYRHYRPRHQQHAYYAKGAIHLSALT